LIEIKNKTSALKHKPAPQAIVSGRTNNWVKCENDIFDKVTIKPAVLAYRYMLMERVFQRFNNQMCRDNSNQNYKNRHTGRCLRTHRTERADTDFR